MHPALQLLAPLALFVPAVAAVAAAEGHAPAPRAGLGMSAGPLGSGLRPGGMSLPSAMPLPMPEAEQVRIEQRVTIRIGPRPAPMPMMPPAMFEEGDFGGGSRIIERKMGKCLPLSAIAGVSPAAKNRLLLLLRDNRVVRATLDKNCQGRDFYSGFLVARNADGMVCTGRDELLARSGAKCKVSGYKQLIEVDD